MDKSELSRKIVWFFNDTQATHYISAISLGASRIEQHSTQTKSKGAGMTPLSHGPHNHLSGPEDCNDNDIPSL